jgi:integrase
MFCNTTGRFLNPESISQLFDRIVQRSGLSRVRFHDLRHTHASLLVVYRLTRRETPAQWLALPLDGRRRR